MIYLEEIAKDIATNNYGGFTTVGGDIFVYRMNEDINRGILLTDRLTGTLRFNDLPDYRSSVFNIAVRGTERKSVIDSMHAISEGIKTEEEKQLGGVLFKYIYPQTDPMTFPISEGDYIEAFCRFDVKFVIQNYSY